MIDEYALLKQSSRFMDLRQLEKDYLLTLLLYEIYREFNDELIFKGGTSLKYFYNLNRFSEDLEFSFNGKDDSNKKIMNKVDRALKHVNLQYNIQKIEHRGHKVENNVVCINYEVRIKGPLYNRHKQMQNIDIDISIRNDIIKPPDIKYLMPPYMDIPAFTISVMNIYEIIAEKVTSIIERDKMRDIYDLYFLLSFKNIGLDKSLIIQKMELRNEEFNDKKLFEKINNALKISRWKLELSYLINPLPDNKIVVESLIKNF